MPETQANRKETQSWGVRWSQGVTGSSRMVATMYRCNIKAAACNTWGALQFGRSLGFGGFLQGRTLGLLKVFLALAGTDRGCA